MAFLETRGGEGRGGGRRGEGGGRKGEEGGGEGRGGGRRGEEGEACNELKLCTCIYRLVFRARN